MKITKRMHKKEVTIYGHSIFQWPIYK